MSGCLCGCGQDAGVYPASRHRRAATPHIFPGAPRQWLLGHWLRLAVRWNVDPETGCWMWAGKIGTGGYGDCWDRTKHSVRKAHRVVYEEQVGPIPDGLELDHLCRVRACVNPAHMEPVTRHENIQRSPIAKLTPEQVCEISARCAAGLETQRAISDDYPVLPGAIGLIARGLAWKNLQDSTTTK